MPQINKLKTYLSYIVLCAYPITTIITYGSGSKLNVSIADIFILLLGIVYLIDIKNFSLSRNFPFAWYFIFLVFIAFLSGMINMRTGINSVGYSGLVTEAIKLAISGAYAFTAYNALQIGSDNRSNINEIAICWLIGLYVCIVYGLYAHIGTLSGYNVVLFTTPLSNHNRFLGTQTDPNAAAFYLSVSFFIVILSALSLFKTRKQRIFLLITDLLVFICIILTLSRGGWVGLAAGGATVLASLMPKIKNIDIKKLLYSAAIAIIAIAIALLVDDKLMSGYFRKNIVERASVFTSGGGTFESRINLTKASLKMGIDHPIIGVGRGNFRLNSKEYLLGLGVDWERDSSVYDQIVSHNTLAGMFVELGIIGAAVFASIFIIMTVRIIRSKRFDYYIKAIIIALWISVFVQSLALSLENTRVLWVLTGIFLKLTEEDEKQQRQIREEIL